MHIRSLTAASAIVLALGAPALANAAISEFRAGGVTFKESSTIGIVREDLYLSADEIRVNYIYNSNAGEAQTVTIGFPMPAVPLDGGPDYMGGNVEELPDMQNYMQFSAVANGVPVEVTLHEFAYLGDFNVTEELKGLGVPLYLPAEQQGAFVTGIDDKTRQYLVDHGFFGAEPDPEQMEYWTPAWSYQTVYEWEQTFNPGANELSIKYVPLNGYPGDIGFAYEGGDPDAAEYLAEGEVLSPFPTENEIEYCIDDELKAAIKRRKDAGEYYEVVTQGYIVKTAQYWHNTMDEFVLTVDKADKDVGNFDMVAFCPLGARKISDTQFQWTANNYWADRDIAVVYYKFYGSEE